ncbi:MAG: YbfB/YjiJ family MFS transporter [Gammaproteobacteria bacterium]|nr:YbfB/YjiJ family MFS transporter [Gammaproteobacteria bacterium]
MANQLDRLKVLSAGIISLILMLGIARFSYTPMLPLMQAQAGLGISEGGWLAAINYIGYLSGAIIAASISDLQLKDKLYRIGLVVAVLTTWMMGISDNFWLWSASRFLAGLSSAAGLLIGSGLIMNWLIRHDFRSELGIHFGGLGLGIAFCAIIVELTLTHLSWSEQWYLMTIAGLFLMIPAWGWLPKPDASGITQSGNTMQDNPPGKRFLQTFMIVYFCAGVGYVVSATFIVDIVNELPGMEGKGAWTFMVIGLAAAPACIVWDLIARKVGDINALIMAFLLKIVAVLIPALTANIFLVMISAALFGATFLGIVSLVLSMAGRYYPTKPAKMMGKMTISYGIAQIAAPAITGMIAEYSDGSYSNGLYLATGMLIIGSILMFRLKALEQKAA